jgi:hypothetical protein
VAEDSYFAVTWRDPEAGGSTTLRCRKVQDSDLGVGFICLSDFVFEGGRLLNPVEDALRTRLAGTRRLHINVFSIQQIAEVGAPPGLSLTSRSNLVILPTPSD